MDNGAYSSESVEKKDTLQMQGTLGFSMTSRLDRFLASMGLVRSKHIPNLMEGFLQAGKLIGYSQGYQDGLAQGQLQLWERN